MTLKEKIVCQYHKDPIICLEIIELGTMEKAGIIVLNVSSWASELSRRRWYVYYRTLTFHPCNKDTFQGYGNFSSSSLTKN